MFQKQMWPLKAHVGIQTCLETERGTRDGKIVFSNHISRFVIVHLGFAAVYLHLTKLFFSPKTNI